VVVAISGVVNIGVVIWIFLRQQGWETTKSTRENVERHKQRIREAKAFWIEEIVLRSSVPSLQKVLGEYAVKLLTYHQTSPRTAHDKSAEIRLWRQQIENIRLSLVEPGLHVAPSEFTKVADLIEDLDDIVTTELARDGGVEDGGDPAKKAYARFNVLRNELNAKLYAAHMLVFREEDPTE